MDLRKVSENQACKRHLGIFPYGLSHLFHVVTAEETRWLLKIPSKERSQGGNATLKSGVLRARFKRLKLNWFTHKTWIEYQAKCQIQEKNYKPVNTIIIQKNSNGFHSTGLSVSHFGFFTSAKEQKWKPREGSVSLWVFIWQRGKPGTCRSMWGIDAFKTHRKNYQD